MNVVKIAAGLACGLTILLLVLAVTTEKTETALYNRTLKMLMEQEDLHSEQEVKERFPILLTIEANIQQIEDLDQMLLRKAQSLAPVEEEMLEMEYYTQKVAQLRSAVKKELLALIATYNERMPSAYHVFK